MLGGVGGEGGVGVEGRTRGGGEMCQHVGILAGVCVLE